MLAVKSSYHAHCQKHPGDSDDRFLVTSAFFERKVAIADFRKLLSPNRTECTLNEQRLDIRSGSADSGGFLLPGTFVVLRRKPSPGAKVLRGGKHGHIHSDFRNDADGSKGLDTRCRHNKTQLGQILLSDRQDQRFQIQFA